MAPANFCHAMPNTLTRSSRYGVGKEIAGAIYVHREYEEVLGEVVVKAKHELPAGFEYHVVKYDQRTGNVSFVETNDFDTAEEPAVGKIVTVRADGTIRHQMQQEDPPIYHHKWLFVRDDYGGFDVEASKRRSEIWAALPGVDRSRIGRLSYWESEVVPRIGDSD